MILNTTETIVTLAGLGLSAFVIWFFFFPPKQKVPVRASNETENRVKSS